jgi:hypothetical protein
MLYIFTFTYETLLFQYEVSYGTWLEPCKEYAAQSLEVNKIMDLLGMGSMFQF